MLLRASSNRHGVHDSLIALQHLMASRSGVMTALSSQRTWIPDARLLLLSISSTRSSALKKLLYAMSYASCRSTGKRSHGTCSGPLHRYQTDANTAQLRCGVLLIAM